jgi:hypothetical protein
MHTSNTMLELYILRCEVRAFCNEDLSQRLKSSRTRRRSRWKQLNHRLLLQQQRGRCGRRRRGMSQRLHQVRRISPGIMCNPTVPITCLWMTR